MELPEHRANTKVGEGGSVENSRKGNQQLGRRRTKCDKGGSSRIFLQLESLAKDLETRHQEIASQLDVIKDEYADNL